MHQYEFINCYKRNTQECTQACLILQFVFLATKPHCLSVTLIMEADPALMLEAYLCLIQACY